MLRARGELALAEGRPDDAWKFATELLEMASRSDSRKHIARAQCLQSEVLGADCKLEEAAQSAALAERIGTPREEWMASAALGRVLIRVGRDDEATAQFERATGKLDKTAAGLTTPRLRQAFVNAKPVLALGATPFQWTVLGL